ncbi:hypothetical protein MBRA1_002405 [Malassezia brasiliensis]|uniref:F-box domain-containing protein n=1 Tax=Malassezia brasiliensis TaxID=1821822 RepID=A0AAF0DU35_9BASI|nr:hypothetical protein MBRA1_002405 [Malassezia brasiliensis]
MHEWPCELVPGVLDALAWRVGDLAACCRVSRMWNMWATPRLYERLWLRDHLRVIRVFRTLADAPHLARMVRILELRVYPFGLPAEQLEQLEEQIVRTLHAAVHLRELCWTRDGSLNDRLLDTMFAHLLELRKLEITGNSRLWSPDLLAMRLPPSVRELHVVLPDRSLVQHLAAIVERAAPLEVLSVLCMVRAYGLMQNSALITDALLETLAGSTRLRRLTLVGCKNVHGPGVVRLAQAGALEGLALEGVGMPPEAFAQLLPFTHGLRALTLTYPGRAEDVAPFFARVAELVSGCDALSSLTLYARSGSPPALGSDGEEAPAAAPMHPVRSAPLPTAATTEVAVVPAAAAATSPALSTSLVRRLIFGRTARTLRRLWVLEMGVSLYQLEMLACSALAACLEDLVVHLFEADVARLAVLLSKFSRLRSVHIMSHVRSAAEYARDDLLYIARHCGEHLAQIGFRNRVWNVVVRGDERHLAPYDMAAGVYPEKLLAVRAVR